MFEILVAGLPDIAESSWGRALPLVSWFDGGKKYVRFPTPKVKSIIEWNMNKKVYNEKKADVLPFEKLKLKFQVGKPIQTLTQLLLSQSLHDYGLV